MKNKCVENSSFRDPSGFIYYERGKVIRKINPIYFYEYDFLMNSGLYQELVDCHLLIEHKEIKRTKQEILLEVARVPYITYPYEWTFEELKDAALLTIRINQIAMQYGMILKDATAYNVQFIGNKPIFIDTLSFMTYEENTPWGAYGQFCRHFVAPLALMKNIDVRMNELLKNHIDGIPLDLCSSLLGRKGGMISYLHIKLQNKSIQKHQNDGRNEVASIQIKKESILNMLSMLERQIQSLVLKKYSTEWMNYYENSNYNDSAIRSKESLVLQYCKKLHLKKDDLIFDIGANDGHFSYLLEKEVPSSILSFDIDSNSVERSYLNNKGRSSSVLPIIMDIFNPSSGIGFSNDERKSFMDRGSATVTLSLAFLHHLVISNNVPFDMVAKFFFQITKYLIIEFVPKEDSQVQLLLKTRRDIFEFYTIDSFKKSFSKYFNICEEDKILHSERTLFLMEAKDEKVSEE